MEKFTIHAIAKKLPVCETNEDERRDVVSTCKNKAEFSAQRAGKCAAEFLADIKVAD